jgi:hypothetical protein
LADIDRVLKKTLNVDYRDKIPKIDLEEKFEGLWTRIATKPVKYFYTGSTKVDLPNDKEA